MALQDHIDDIERRFRAGETMQEIGTQYGCSRERIRQLSPTHAYVGQRHSTRKRGIRWNLTFKEWWAVWEMSGMLAKRGKGHGKYCMARIDFTGAYETGNVHIMTAVGAAANYWVWI